MYDFTVRLCATYLNWSLLFYFMADYSYSYIIFVRFVNGAWYCILAPVLAWKCVSRWNVRGEFAQQETNQHFFIHFIGAQADVNVALGKVAYQSSIWHDTRVSTVAAGAVDGNTDGYYNRGSCSSTNPSASPWWIVDLGRHCSISYLRVYNRDILGKFLIP